MLNRTVEDRQLKLELVEAREVLVRYIPLTPQTPVPFWDFRNVLALLDHFLNDLIPIAVSFLLLEKNFVR